MNSGPCWTPVMWCFELLPLRAAPCEETVAWFYLDVVRFYLDVMRFYLDLVRFYLDVAWFYLDETRVHYSRP